MTNNMQILAGLGSALATDVVWKNTPGANAFRLGMLAATSPEPNKPEKSPLAFIEHYHWGLLLLIMARRAGKYKSFLDGMGTGLIVAEPMSEHPFGIGKTEQEVQGNVAFGTLLSSILAMDLLRGK